MELIKVVIADDEKLIREGMKNYIPWQKEGMMLVGTAKNGQEALEIFAREKADILITDIRMPVMNGIDLLEIMEREYPKAYLIFISAYGDFEYTKKAIKSRIVYDYLLKPFEIEDLIELLRELISHVQLQKLITNEDKVSDNIKEQQNDYSMYTPTIQNCLTLIDQLYPRQDLSLTTLSEELGLSTNYLSSIFKNEVGKGFVKYLQEKRIEEGKKLLPNVSFKTYEIANRIGIEDSRYFSRLFKEINGITPSEFRENYYRSRKDTSYE